MARQIAVLSLAVALLTGCTVEEASTPDPQAASEAASPEDAWRQPIFEGLGDEHFPITTASADAQAYFDQGLRLAWAFNHAAADFAFNEAALADPDCAMCAWGSALVLGPNVNAEMDPRNAPRAWALAKRAHSLARATGTELERALTGALLARYAPEAPADRTELDVEYADAMRAIMAEHPDDAHVVALTAEALMDLHPWDFWLADGEERPWTDEIVAALEHALELDPSHIGAIHLYIHAVEQSQEAGRAEPYADQLADLAPAAGHLVHMPAHIYMRIGRYHDSTLNNMKAADADAAFVSVCRSNSPIYLAGYIPHNWHFGWVTAAIEGWSEQAFAMAEGTAAQLTPELLRAPGMGVAQHFLMQPTYALVRFGRWDELLAAPAPDADLIYARGIWHYGRGRALAATGDLDGARAEHEALATIQASDELANLAFFREPGRGQLVMAVAERMLAGEIALAAGDLDAAISMFEEAVVREDAIPYNEPPDWYYPARHSLGVALLEKGDAEAAEAVYRADLDLMPENGWALLGLTQALVAQGRGEEAADVQARFDLAWRHADVEIVASRI
ncbi:MAG: tetratricopeptide repeat protein [Pseudomonadales bacterium]|jgi:tetratricopeptide (TPR) repeat protein|nr:tetratricopeptide repeat protein [Pseudomonadales bacterium]